MARFWLVATILLVFSGIAAADDEIHDLAAVDNLDAVKALLADSPQLLEKKNDLGYTPFQWAAMKASWNVAGYLMDHGADVKDIAPDGGSVLHRIAHYHAPEMMQKAISKGAEVDLQNRWGRTPLHVAARRGCVEVAGVLLKHGAKVNAVTREGWTPLHVARKSGHADMVKFLLSRGADPEIKDSSGKTASEYDYQRPQAQAITAAELKEYCGDYSFGGGYWTKVWLEDGKLKLDEHSIDILHYYAKDKFFCEQEPWKISFTRNSAGEIEKIQLQFLRRTVEAVKADRDQH